MIESDQLSLGAIKYFAFCDQKVVLFRRSNGQVTAFDAFCPHNGANFSAGKLIKIDNQDCIKCVFHDWSFRADDGLCVDVPYAKDRSKLCFARQPPSQQTSTSYSKPLKLLTLRGKRLSLQAHTWLLLEISPHFFLLQISIRRKFQACVAKSLTRDLSEEKLAKVPARAVL